VRLAWGIPVSSAAIFGLVGLAINAAGIAFIALQVVLARRQLYQAQDINEQEITREKRQATVNFYMTTIEQRARLKETLPEDWDADGIGGFIKSALSKDDDAQQKCISDYLAYFEVLAVGVGANIYDIEVLYTIAEGRLLNISRNYQPYIQAMREKTGLATLYIELEWLAERLTEMGKTMPDYRVFAERGDLLESFKIPPR
jgi:Domain of unknown function (DUF4760)